MTLRIKNWHQFQHFKDRRPPWVKLYRDLLDDIEWHDLDSKAAKVLVMLWLIASETDGILPEPKKLAFRLRLSEAVTSELLSKLSHWLEQDDNGVISDGYRGDAPETEAERETEKRQRPARKAPEDFTLTAEMRAWAAKEAPGVDVDRETAKMRDHTFSKARTDWPAVWRNWIREAFDRLQSRGGAAKPQPAARHTDSAEDTRRMLDAQKQGTRTGVPEQLRGVVAHLTGRKTG